VSEVLNRAGRQSGGGRERRRLRNVLVVFDAASALVLLVVLQRKVLPRLTDPLRYAAPQEAPLPVLMSPSRPRDSRASWPNV
jgi:hypothetical protein